MSLAILLVLIGVASWLIWSTFRRERARLQSILRDLQSIRQPQKRKSDVTQLEQDPVTGEYRPVKED